MTILYFVTGFFLAALATMVLLFLCRPLMGPEPSLSMRTFAMYAPLLVGVPYGARVSWIGVKEELKLGTALKRGLFL